MKARFALIGALGLAAAVSRPAAAQDIKDFVAWAAMMSTPYGGLPPVVTPAMSGSTLGRKGTVFELRYGHWALGDEDPGIHIGGIGARFGRLGVVLGYEGCSGCDGNVIGGVDYDATIVSQTLTGNGASSLFTVGMRPAFGIGHSVGGPGGAAELSGTVDIPIAVSVPIGKTARMVPFISPGGGFGSVRSGDDSETGTRASLAFGAGLVDLAPGLSLNLSWRKIFLESAPMTIGLGLTLGRR
jgi:hypothetical protein